MENADPDTPERRVRLKAEENVLTVVVVVVVVVVVACVVDLGCVVRGTGARCCT